MSNICSYSANFTPDDFNKIIVAIVALIAVFLGPFIQFKIAKRQVAMQEEIAKRQTETQQQIAKRQIADSISLRRQVWIDELRKDASEYLTHIARIEDLKRPDTNLSEEDQKKNFEERAAASARGHELGIRIKLRLNPLEDEHNELVRLLEVLSNVCKDPPPNETKEQIALAQTAFRKARGDVISHIQTILKLEWEKVKRGEV
jgi:hypothetical protein